MSLHVTSTGSIAAQLIDPTDSVLLRATNAATMAGVNPEGRITLPAVRTSTSWAVRDVLAEPGTVGAKASNLVALASALPEWIHVRSWQGLQTGWGFDQGEIACGNGVCGMGVPVGRESVGWVCLWGGAVLPGLPSQCLDCIHIPRLHQYLDCVNSFPQPPYGQVPASVCLPFGTFERVIAHPSNSQTTWTLEKLLKELAEYSTDSGVPPTLAAIRDLVTTFLKVCSFGLRQCWLSVCMALCWLLSALLCVAVVPFV